MTEKWKKSENLAFCHTPDNFPGEPKLNQKKNFTQTSSSPEGASSWNRDLLTFHTIFYNSALPEFLLPYIGFGVMLEFLDML